MDQPAPLTINAVVVEFLRERERRLSAKRLSKYRQVLDLFRIYLDGYWPGEPQQDYDRVTKLGGTYATWFGPEHILDGYPEFLGYYMGHKVYGSLETKRAAGGVMKRFAEWLAEKGHIRSAPEAIARSQRASRELPSAERACRVLEQCVERPVVGRMIGRIEDHFTITRVEAGRIWLSPLTEAGKKVGPVPVPRRATELLEVNRDIGGVVERTSRGWRLAEVWKVTP
jgi:hypothetical protein